MLVSENPTVKNYIKCSFFLRLTFNFFKQLPKQSSDYGYSLLLTSFFPLSKLLPELWQTASL